MSLRLKNPHSILAALEKRPGDVLELRLPSKGGGSAWDEVRARAEQAGVPLKTGRPAPHQDRKRRRGKDEPAKSGREGLGEALVRELPGVPLGELFETSAGRDGGHGLWVALDCLQDPHNLGAIIRTAAFFGVRGLLMTVDRAAPLSAVAYDVAAGGVEHVPISVQVNLGRALDVAKEAGIWILGTSEHADEEFGQIPRDRPWLLVIGNEGRGLRQLTMERCDTLCRIPARGTIGSLNASVAAGILIAGLS